MQRKLLMAALGASLAGTAFAADRVGPDSKRPVPRYESLASPEVYGRRGPSDGHHVDWIYQRRGLPVQILEEAGPWRRVRDPAGGETWMHAIKLGKQRTAYVHGAKRIPLFSAPRPQARTLAYMQSGVVAELTACMGGWRKLKVDGREGWADAEHLWGADDCRGLER